MTSSAADGWSPAAAGPTRAALRKTIGLAHWWLGRTAETAQEAALRAKLEIGHAALALAQSVQDATAIKKRKAPKRERQRKRLWLTWAVAATAGFVLAARVARRRTGRR